MNEYNQIHNEHLGISKVSDNANANVALIAVRF